MPIWKMFSSVLPASVSCASSRKTLTDKRPPATLALQGETVMLRRLGMGFMVVGMLLAGGCGSCDNDKKDGDTAGPEGSLCRPPPKGPYCPQGYVCELSDEVEKGHPDAFGECVKVKEDTYKECDVKVPCTDSHHGCVPITPPLCDSRNTTKFCECDGFYPDGKPKEPDDKVPESPTTGPTTTK